jgi:hypothetical protein
MSGDASQNAITGASGTPDARSATITVTTPQEQNGESAPHKTRENDHCGEPSGERAGDQIFRASRLGVGSERN